MGTISCSGCSPGSHIPTEMGHHSLCWDHCVHGSSQYPLGTWYWFLCHSMQEHPPSTYSECLGKLEVFLQLPRAGFVLIKPPPSLFSPWQHLPGATGGIELFLPGVLLTQVRTSAPLSAPKLLLVAPWVCHQSQVRLEVDILRGRNPLPPAFLVDLPLLPSRGALEGGCALAWSSCQEAVRSYRQADD